MEKKQQFQTRPIQSLLQHPLQQTQHWSNIFHNQVCSSILFCPKCTSPTQMSLFITISINRLLKHNVEIGTNSTKMVKSDENKKECYLLFLLSFRFLSKEYLHTISNDKMHQKFEFKNLLCLCFAFCVCVLHFAFCVLKLCSQILCFFHIKSLFLQRIWIYLLFYSHMEPKTYLFKPKNPFKLHQNPVTQSNLKLQRETHYAVLGTLMHYRTPSCSVGYPRGANIGCYCFLGPMKTICLVNEKGYIFAWNWSFFVLRTCIHFS